MSEASEFDILCAEIVAWHNKAFPWETMEQIGLGIGEESGEILRTILKESHGPSDRRAHVDWKGERAAEAIDVFIYLVILAGRDGFDLLGMARECFEAVRDRYPEAVDPEAGRPVEALPPNHLRDPDGQVWRVVDTWTVGGCVSGFLEKVVP